MSKNIIACFSGTGNSYYIAEKLAEKLGDFEVIMIPDLLNDPSLLGNFEQLGIVFPTYYFVPPEMVVRFVKTVLTEYDLKNLENLFVITAVGVRPIYSLRIMEYILTKSGCAPSYSSSINTINTYVPMFSIPKKEKHDEEMKKLDKEIEKTAEDLKQGKMKLVKFAPLYRLYFSIAKKMVYKNTASKYFVINESCKGCGICVSRCPSHCIELKDGKAVFNKNECQNCWACYHSCPEHSFAPKKAVKGGILTWYQNDNINYHPDYSKNK